MEVAPSERPDILALGAARNVELHGLTLLQAPETARLDRRGVHKNISATLLTDEAIAFGVVEPFTVPCSAVLILVFLFV